MRNILVFAPPGLRCFTPSLFQIVLCGSIHVFVRGIFVGRGRLGVNMPRVAMGTFDLCDVSQVALFRANVRQAHL